MRSRNVRGAARRCDGPQPTASAAANTAAASSRPYHAIDIKRSFRISPARADGRKRPRSPSGRTKSLTVQAIVRSLWHNMTKARLSWRYCEGAADGDPDRGRASCSCCAQGPCQKCRRPLRTSGAARQSDRGMNVTSRARTGLERLRRHRGVRQQPRPHGRGRRQGARRLPEAARGGPGRRPGPTRSPTWSRRSARSPNTGCADPQRALELQTSLGQAYLDLWAQRGQAHGRRRRSTRRRRARPDATSASPIRNGREPVLRLPQAGLSAHRALGRPPGRRTPRGSTRTPGTRPSSTSRQIANAISPSNFVLTNPELLRETLESATPRISCAACTCWPRTSRPAAAT